MPSKDLENPIKHNAEIKALVLESEGLNSDSARLAEIIQRLKETRQTLANNKQESEKSSFNYADTLLISFLINNVVEFLNEKNLDVDSPLEMIKLTKEEMHLASFKYFIEELKHDLESDENYNPKDKKDKLVSNIDLFERLYKKIESREMLEIDQEISVEDKITKAADSLLVEVDNRINALSVNEDVAETTTSKTIDLESKINFQIVLNTPNANTYAVHFNKMFDTEVFRIESLVSKIDRDSDEDSKPPEQKDFEKIQQEQLTSALQQFEVHSNKMLMIFLRSNGTLGDNDETAGLMKFFLPFARKEIGDRPTTTNTVNKRFEQIVTEILGEEKGEHWINIFGSIGLTILHSSYIDTLGRKKANQGGSGTQSLASNPEELKNEDVGSDGKEGDQDFSARNTYDFLIDGDKEIGKDLIFENAKMMRLVMFLQPFLITDFEEKYHGRWDHSDSNDSREAFDAFINNFTYYISYYLSYQQSIAKNGLNSEITINRKKIFDDWLSSPDTELNTKQQKYFKSFDNRYSTFLKRSNEQDYSKSFISFDDYDENKDVVVTIAREEDFYSGGKDEQFKFTQQDIENLADENDPEAYKKRMISHLSGRMGTSLGVGLHNFTTKFATGSTPAGGLAFYRDVITSISPFSYFNYKGYKDPTAQPYVTSYKLGWNIADVGKKIELSDREAIEAERNPDFIIDEQREIGNYESTNNMGLSSALTIAANLATSGILRQRKIDLGIIRTPYDKIKTAYPGAYTFIVSGIRKRQNETTGFDSWFAGYKQYVNFTKVVNGVPGGTTNFDTIRKKDPEDFRNELVVSLRDLIHNTFSALKSSKPWFRWDFIAQDLIRYIDKIQKIYRVCDDDDKGMKLLVDQLRNTLVSHTVNMAGVGVTKYKKILKADPNDSTKKIISGYKIERGLIANYIQETGIKQDLYDNKDILTPEEYELIKNNNPEYPFKVFAIGDNTHFEGSDLIMNGDQLPRAENQSDEKIEESKMPDIRDYLLNLLPKTKIRRSILGNVWLHTINNAVLDAAALPIARSEPFFGFRQLVKHPKAALSLKRFNLKNKDFTDIIEPAMIAANYGTEDSKK
jgi:hypothetical protein